MPEFSYQEVFNMVDSLGELTSRIKELLKISELSNQDIKNVIALYEKRKTYIEDIDKWLSSENGKTFVKNNKQKWQQKIGTFIDTDKVNLDKIKRITEEKSHSLRNLIKKKNVLLYNKVEK